MAVGSPDTDVLVVGAGPTGLVMAAELVSRGVPCRTIDRAPERSPHSRALVVHARSLELLDKMGIAAELVDRGRRTMRVSIYVDGRRAADLQLGDIGVDDTSFPFVLFVSQAETEALLERHLNDLGGAVERPVELLSLTQDAEGVTAHLRRGGADETLRARFVVGADGAHSAVRDAAGLAFRGDAYPQDFVLADVGVDWDREPDRLSIFLSRDGLLGVFPLPGAGYRLIASRIGMRADAGDPTLDEFQRLATRLSGAPMRLHDPQCWPASGCITVRSTGTARGACSSPATPPTSTLRRAVRA